MKLKTIALCALVTLPLLLGACTGREAFLEIPCDDFTRDQHLTWELSVDRGDSVVVTLCSNATTGFQWGESAQIADDAVLRQTGHEFVAPEEKAGKEPAPGTAGQEKWTFEAVGKGTTEVSMEYSRPWDDGEKGAWTFRMTVTVK